MVVKLMEVLMDLVKRSHCFLEREAVLGNQEQNGYRKKWGAFCIAQCGLVQ